MASSSQQRLSPVPPPPAPRSSLRSVTAEPSVLGEPSFHGSSYGSSPRGQRSSRRYLPICFRFVRCQGMAPYNRPSLRFAALPSFADHPMRFGSRSLRLWQTGSILESCLLVAPAAKLAHGRLIRPRAGVRILDPSRALPLLLSLDGVIRVRLRCAPDGHVLPQRRCECSTGPTTYQHAEPSKQGHTRRQLRPFPWITSGFPRVLPERFRACRSASLAVRALTWIRTTFTRSGRTRADNCLSRACNFTEAATGG